MISRFFSPHVPGCYLGYEMIIFSAMVALVMHKNFQESTQTS